MDRERKLLYVAVILAVLENLLLLALYANSASLPSTEALMHETLDCQKRLDRIYRDWEAKHGHAPGRGV